MIDKMDKLYDLFKEAQKRIKPENYKRWLAYCLGVMSGKMDRLDFDTMQEGIKKYE